MMVFYTYIKKSDQTEEKNREKNHYIIEGLTALNRSRLCLTKNCILFY